MTDRTAPSSDARKRHHERDMADAHATARARDARVEESFEERAERYGLDWDVVAHLMSEQPTRRAYRTRTQAIDPETGTFTPLTQEPDMTKHDRHDELVALLNKISEESVTASNVLADVLDLLRDRLPERVEVRVAPFDPDLIARNLEAIKHEAKTPMSGHGECCEPGPADDLPGEPVEPGDLRAGDRVAFTYDGERIACTLVSEQDGALLRSDTPNSRGFFPSVVSRGDAWIYVVTDVRLIERAPREDDDPDEALARHSDDANCEWAQYRKDYGVDPTVATHKAFHAGFKAAREHIEAEEAENHPVGCGQMIRDVRDGDGFVTTIDGVMIAKTDSWNDLTERAKKAEAEAKHLRERLDALRADLSPGGLIWTVDAALRRDDERAAKVPAP